MADTPRSYMILELHTATPTGSARILWTELGVSTGANDEAAIRNLVDERPEGQRAGKFVAVPVRSWNPRTRVTKTVTVDTWLVDDKGPVTDENVDPVNAEPPRHVPVGAANNGG